eukprot:5629-Pyramimonas_sp.AAC.1
MPSMLAWSFGAVALCSSPPPPALACCALAALGRSAFLPYCCAAFEIGGGAAGVETGRVVVSG